MEYKLAMQKKDIQWQIENNMCVVRNVPYFQAEYDGEETVDLVVPMTLAALRKLMFEEIIPLDVDFTDYAVV